MTLQDFIKRNNARLVAMARDKVWKREAGKRSEGLETKHGVHVFLDQLRGALDDEAKRDPSHRAAADPPTNPDIAQTAALHGHDLLSRGFSVDEVVHDYGDVCQAVTELAVEQNVDISVADFHTLNRCLDNAIAAAVSTWCADRESDLSTTGANTRPKLQRLVASSLAIFAMLRTGKIGTAGAAVGNLGRQLEEMRALLDVAERSGTTAA